MNDTFESPLRGCASRLVGSFRIVIVASILLLWLGRAAAATVTPTADGNITDGYNTPKDGMPDRVLGTLDVQVVNVPMFEDRGIMEFNVSSLTPSLAPAILTLAVRSRNGPFPFTINVMTYAGDGFLSPGDFNAGSFFSSFEYSGAPEVTLDVTSLVQDIQSRGDIFAGFNFRFAVPSSIGLNGPYVSFGSLEFGPPATITNVPEPRILTLLTTGSLAGIIGWARRRRTGSDKIKFRW